jgi:hypothetical protein
MDLEIKNLNAHGGNGNVDCTGSFHNNNVDLGIGSPRPACRAHDSVRFGS